MIETIIKTKLLKIETTKHTMNSYLTVKILENDWHGVADAAMDLRDLEAEEKAYKHILEEINK